MIRSATVERSHRHDRHNVVGARPRPARSAAPCIEIALPPELRTIEGSAGAFWLSRDNEDDIELTTHIFWATTAAVQAFAGNGLTRAVVWPEACAGPCEYDPTVVRGDVFVGAPRCQATGNSPDLPRGGYTERDCRKPSDKTLESRTAP